MFLSSICPLWAYRMQPLRAFDYLSNGSIGYVGLLLTWTDHTFSPEDHNTSNGSRFIIGIVDMILGSGT